MADYMDEWNSELEEEITAEDLKGLVVYSRDWTVETIMSQIEKGNIDLDPKFQRRNAWTDRKRSKLIESLIIRVPVPELVLAEDPSNEGGFIVIDGKQRLLAIAGYLEPTKFDSWKSPKLRFLQTRSDLNDKTFKSLSENEDFAKDIRLLFNSDIRCTVISAYKNEKVLYDIFYRLNTGSVPLSSQELRQVLNRGRFANFLIESTNEECPVQNVLNTKGPDSRLRDAELLLRYMAVKLFGNEYRGNLSQFFDLTMDSLNRDWDERHKEVESITEQFHETTTLLLNIFPEKKVARKYNYEAQVWEGRFNRALYEVELFYFSKIRPDVAHEKKDEFLTAFRELFNENEFTESISTTTKTIANYYTRFKYFQDLVNSVYDLGIDDIPTPAPDA